MPDDLADITVQRIVVRNGLSMHLASRLLAVIEAETDYLDHVQGPMPTEEHRPGFTH